MSKSQVVINVFRFALCLHSESDQNMCKSDKNTLFLGVTNHNTGLTHKKLLLATETQRKTENINDIYFRSICHVTLYLLL